MANPGQAISQYHHYIPQFILRNFAHPYVAPTAKKRRRKKNDPHPGDHMLHAIDMAKDVPEMVEVLAKRTFGQQDMYRDFVGAANQQDLEKQLSRLESNASMVIRKIQKAFESGDQAVWIERRERNLLRKFLFVMKYRGSSFWRRFRHDNSKEYVANDKALLLEYMDAKGFVRPLDVWFSNIKTILELDMDLEGKWMAELPKRMFPTDAEWYISHTQQMFLAFCTPSSPRDEFILTDNSYNVYEGPSSEMVDPTSGASVGTRWTNYHEFSPISPRLILVLRSMLLPAPEEDSNENIKQWRRTLYQLNAGQHAAPWKTDSILADLPVSKARNSYSTVTDHGIRLIVGEDGSARSNHRFCFRFFPTSSEHTHKINGIFLENASKCLNIAYASLSALQRSLEYYLTVPNGEGFKVMEGGSDDPRLICLKKLERVMKDLGSKKTLVYQDRPDVLTWEDQGAHFERALDSLPDKPSPHMKLHMRLGGTAATLPADLDQARRMLNMRIKVDVWSKGLDETIRERIRVNLRDLFCQLHPRRVWYYLGCIRNMVLKGDHPRPEDTVVRASDIIRSKDLCRLMHFSVMKQIHLIESPDFDIMAEITLDETGSQRLRAIRRHAFGQVGSICDCGIEVVEKQAASARVLVQTTRLHERFTNPFLTEEENVELCTRVITRGDFLKALDGMLEDDVLASLMSVFFNIVYPTYPPNST